MKKKTAVFEFQTEAEKWKVFLDGKWLKFKGQKATKDLQVGVYYSLSWFVMGGSGLSYSIMITQPQEARLTVTRTLDQSKKDAGQVWIILGERT